MGPPQSPAELGTPLMAVGARGARTRQLCPPCLAQGMAPWSGGLGAYAPHCPPGGDHPKRQPGDSDSPREPGVTLGRRVSCQNAAGGQ